jgi:hypothetical protein
MPLVRPAYIDPAVADPKLDFSWDEWKVRSFYKPPDNSLLKRVSFITQRARVALTIAQCEWIAYRFENISPDPAPFQLLESYWAANINLCYGKYWEPIDDAWRGPIRGPLSVALLITCDAIHCTSQSENWAENPAWQSKLAEHLLPAAMLPAFQSWRETVLQRLERFYPASAAAEPDLWEEVDSWGPFVPRELFDPAVDFNPDLTPTLITAFLMGLDFRKNPFLNSPADMLEIGFKGIPYSLEPNRQE